MAENNRDFEGIRSQETRRGRSGRRSLSAYDGSQNSQVHRNLSVSQSRPHSHTLTTNVSAAAPRRVPELLLGSHSRLHRGPQVPGSEFVRFLQRRYPQRPRSPQSPLSQRVHLRQSRRPPQALRSLPAARSSNPPAARHVRRHLARPSIATYTSPGRGRLSAPQFFRPEQGRHRHSVALIQSIRQRIHNEVLAQQEHLQAVESTRAREGPVGSGLRNHRSSQSLRSRVPSLRTQGIRRPPVSTQQVRDAQRNQQMHARRVRRANIPQRTNRASDGRRSASRSRTYNQRSSRSVQDSRDSRVRHSEQRPRTQRDPHPQPRS